MSEQAFLTHLQEHFQQSCDKNVLKFFREKNFEKLLAMGLPQKTHEPFRYLSLRDLYAARFQLPLVKEVDKSTFANAILPECEHSHLVFVDGHFSASLSDMTALASQPVLLPLDVAMGSHGSFLQNYFTRLLKEEKDPFAFVNACFHSQGAFFYLPPKFEVASAVQCIYVVTGIESTLMAPRLHLVLGRESRMRMIITTHYIDKSATHFINPALEVSLEEGSDLDLLNMIDEMPSWHIESMRATLKKRARLNALSVTLGGKIVRQSYVVQLKGEESEANLSGLWMLNKNRTSHIHGTIEHEAPHTRSMQRFKGVLNDASQSSFEGKILVRSQAQKTEAYQLNNNLILSQGALANSKPNLEVFADDVKASHGATFSQLDQDQLFYLSTRGISLPEARRLLIEGFCREMIDKIPYDSLKCKMYSQVENYLQRQE